MQLLFFGYFPSAQLEGRSFLDFLLKCNIYFLRTQWLEIMAGDQKYMQHTGMSLNQLEITKKEKYLHAIIVFSNIAQNTGRMVSHIISSVNAPKEVQNQFTNARTSERDEEVKESLAVRNTLTTLMISVHR